MSDDVQLAVALPPYRQLSSTPAMSFDEAELPLIVAATVGVVDESSRQAAVAAVHQLFGSRLFAPAGRHHLSPLL